MSAPRRRKPRRLDRVLAWIDDALPMSRRDRSDSDWVANGEADARRRRDRLKLHTFEKRGKGGYR